jgi:hypothetical protein
MFDLVLGHRQVVEGGAQDKAEIAGSRPPFRDFWVWGAYVMGMGCRPMGLPMFRPDFLMYK